MSLVQNYIGLDARIYAIVQSLLNGETIDLSNYYTKDEVDALIASGGGSLTIDYNSLTNRPIIDGLLQSNLDLNNNLLLYNGKPLYLPEFNEADSTIVFDNNCVIPNIYTKEEVDQKIAEAGGGGGGTTDYNQLTNKPIDNYVLQKSLDCGAHTLTNIAGIESKIVLIPNVAKLYDYRFMCDLDTLQLIANRTLLATFNNSGITYFAESGKLFSITRDGVADKITSANTALEVFRSKV